jgi:hypothetical protein
MQTDSYIAPSCWASYLINDDASGLEDADIAECDAWVESVGLGAPVGCEDYGFCHWHDAREFCKLATDCSTYSFAKRGEA